VIAPSSRDARGLIKRAIDGWSNDNATSMGAALAFYTLFSLAPLLLVSIAVAGIFVGRNEAQNVLIAQLTQMIGDKAALGIESVLDAAGSRDEGILPAFLGAVTMFIGATTLFAELRQDLDRIWRCHLEKSQGLWGFVRTRLLAFGMVMAVGVLLLLSLAASALLATAGTRWFATSEPFMHALEFASSFVVMTLLFAMIYKLLPSTRIAWRDVWVGAAVTSMLFWVGKFAIGLYIGKAADTSTFSAAGTLTVVIVWVYYSSMVFFLGAEFTREFALHLGSRKHQRGLPERRRGSIEAANDEEMVERAKKIVKGGDPLTSGP
jgi:membrane protein